MTPVPALEFRYSSNSAAEFKVQISRCNHFGGKRVTTTMSRSAFDIELDDLTLARARRGDMTACEHLFRLYNQPAYAISLRICQCPHLAQDVTQEAFITAFRRIRQFRGDAPFWGWLRRVVVNHAISAVRRLPGNAMVELDESHAVHHGEQDRIDLSGDLETALSKLNGEDRAVVWLHDVEGYSHKEIAGFFGMTESFSKTRLSRAHARLRECIDPSLVPGNASTKSAGNQGLGDDWGPASPTAMLNLSAEF